MRKYKTGSSWAFWRWTEVDSEFITRLHIFKSPWFDLCIHWIKKADPEPYLHDHPVTFLSLILRGSYFETRRIGDRYMPLAFRNRFNFIRATPADRHSIMAVSKGGCITLCFMGTKRRTWGYHLPEGKWIDWQSYYAAQRANKESQKQGVT